MSSRWSLYPQGRPGKTGLRVRSGLKGSGLQPQHNRRNLRVTTGLKSGGTNHGNHNVVALALADVLKMYPDPIRRRVRG